MSAYAKAQRYDLADLLNLFADLFAPFVFFLFQDRSPARPVAETPAPVAPPAPVAVAPTEDEDTQEIEVPIVTREEIDDAATVTETEQEADEPTIAEPLYVRVAKGKAVKYAPARGHEDGPRYRREASGKRAKYVAVA